MNSVPRNPTARPRVGGLDRSRTHLVVRMLTLSLVMLLVLMGAVSFIAWSSLHPHLPAVTVQTLTVSNFNLSNSQLSGNYRVELNVSNTNRRMSLLVDHFSICVTYRGVPISRNISDSWRIMQIPKYRSSGVEFEMDTSRLSDKMVRKVFRAGISGDWSNGVVSFDVGMNIRVKFRAGSWLSRQKLLVVACRNLNVEFPGGTVTGKLREGAKVCRVDFQ